MPVELALIHSISLPPGRYGGDAIERLFTNRLDADAHPYYAALRGIQVSSHFLVRRDGAVLQFVSCEMRAWHAGRSVWRGREDCNHHSIGIELEGLVQWGPLTITPAYTWMDARYRDGFLACTAAPCTAPTLPVAAGNRMPGLAKQQGYLLLAWAPGWANSVFTLEATHTGRMAVNDRNTDATAASTLFNLGLRFEQRRGQWTWRQFARVDNLTNRAHAGSLIVNEGSGRFFEPGARRSV